MDDIMPTVSECEACPEYDHEHHNCPKWCGVIRNTVEELKAERRRGKWIVQDGKVVCSECFEPHIETHFCPNCGADMREERHAEDHDF